MNTQFLLRLADALESLVNPETQTDVGFYFPLWICTDEETSQLDTSGHSCGTVACIGGWALYLHFGKDIKRASRYSGDIATMQEIMKLYDHRFFELCTPDIADCTKVTPDTAANVVRHLVTTGEVDWERFGHPVAHVSADVELA